MNNDDEWQTVTRVSKKRPGRGNKRRQRRPGALGESSGSNASLPPTESEHDDAETDRTTRGVLIKCVKDIQSSHFFRDLVVSLDYGDLNSSGDHLDIVCYGVGNFASTSRTPSAPLWQLACALALSHSLGGVVAHEKEESTDVTKESSTKVTFHYFEPLMTKTEAAILQTFNVHIIEENERGKRHVSGPTLFFMPHCPMSLYVSVLHANWDNLLSSPDLKLVTIFGNSLFAYANRLEPNGRKEDNNKENTESDPAVIAVKPIQFLKFLMLPVSGLASSVESPIVASRDDVQDMPGHFETAFNDSYVMRLAVCECGSDREAAPIVAHVCKRCGRYASMPERPVLTNVGTDDETI